MNASLCHSLIAAVIAATVTLPAWSSGGPDAFGYTWISSNDPSGPALEWIDITANGTLVTGLADDNSSPNVVTLPLPFRYYWRDYTTLKIGSNGWVGFEGISNIASCFPAIPTAGGVGDAYLAPLMSDLNFTGAGNPGTVRTYFDVAANRFIVSYVNTPFWVVAAPGWSGSNSFQIVLDYTDRSIRFNYQGLSAFNNAGGCVDMVVGIESPNGLYGLSVNQDTQPAANQTIRFDYPAVPGIAVVDATPEQVLSASKKAVIAETTVPLTLTASVRNAGSAATSAPIDVRAEVLVPDLAGVSAYDQTLPIASLAAGAAQLVSYVPDYTVAAGKQAVRVSVSGGGDINVGNDVATVELFGLDPALGAQQVSYVSGETGNTTINWNGGDSDEGMAAEFVMPAPNYVVYSLGATISASTPAAGYALELRAHDGVDGLPGTLLERIDVPAGTVVNGQWQDFPLNTPRVVDAEGFYVVWYQMGTTTFLAGKNNGVPSRRMLELLSGSYATFRSNETIDMFLRANVAPSPVFADGFE